MSDRHKLAQARVKLRVALRSLREAQDAHDGTWERGIMVAVARANVLAAMETVERLTTDDDRATTVEALRRVAS